MQKKKRSRLAVVNEGGEKVPKTFVVERGKVGHVLSQLVLDLRQVMEPYTASKLKVGSHKVSDVPCTDIPFHKVLPEHIDRKSVV